MLNCPVLKISKTNIFFFFFFTTFKDIETLNVKSQYSEF